MATTNSSEADDDCDHRSDAYTLSADVSESESAITLSDSFTISPPRFRSISDIPAPPHITLPLECHANVVDKRDATDPSQVELMKERFAKLLLGEDMSGGGKGVGTALAISNAITNLSATVFGELWRLEPLASQKKSMWYREMEWLLCVSDSIVELIPSFQELPGGGTYEVMVTRPRMDLYVNLPALKKLDGMLISILDGFRDTEFQYVDRGGILVDGSEQNESHPCSPFSRRCSVRLEEKWWLPFPKVPPRGLSDNTRKRLQQFRECTIQIFKAAVAINTCVLSEMEIPDVYLDSLPKSAKACLGETIYHYLTDNQFSPDCLLEYLEMSSEYTILEIANRIEASVHIWRHKYFKRQLSRAKSGRSWGGKVKGLVSDKKKNKFLHQRAETLLQNLKLQFPGLPQTALDIQKIQYNKDVGQSILESYSRVIESLAFNLMTRIDDLQYVDDTTRQRAAAESSPMLGESDSASSPPTQKHISPSLFSIQHTSCSS